MGTNNYKRIYWSISNSTCTRDLNPVLVCTRPPPSPATSTEKYLLQLIRLRFSRGELAVCYICGWLRGIGTLKKKEYPLVDT